MKAKRFHSGNYLPLDVLLELPQVRALRALRHFDWVSLRELGDALDEHEVNRQTSLYRALKKLIALDHVEIERNRFQQRYRITQSGRVEHDRLLGLALVGEPRRRAS